jgi:hypothetical protein
MRSGRPAIQGLAVQEWVHPCPLGGGRIGVYEPMIVITPYGAQRTSRARDPTLPQSGAILLHNDCYGSEPYERGENG